MNDDDLPDFEDWSHPGRQLRPERMKTKAKAVLLVLAGIVLYAIAWYLI